jgi:hypothetical protein
VPEHASKILCELLFIFFRDSAESMLNGRGDEVVAKTNLFR